MAEPAVLVGNDVHPRALNAPRRPRVAFVLPFCTHYTVGLFEILAQQYEADFFFFSDGNEWYWSRGNRPTIGKFRYEYLRGFRIGRTRVAPSLFLRLTSAPYDAIVASIDGRFALPIALSCAHLKRIPFVLWTGIWNRIETPIHKILFPATRFVYREADAVVVYGEHVKSYLEKEGVTASRIFVAPHAVDNNQYALPLAPHQARSLRQELKLTEANRVILFVGRLEREKGIADLLEAFGAIADREAVLVIVGEGTESAALRQKTQQLRIAERVRFVGHVPPIRVRSYYALAHMLVVSSIRTPRVTELWGLVVNEAMNQGVPVIATDAVGAAAGGLVRDGQNGFIVPQANPKALAITIKRILADQELRERMSEQSRAAIRDWSYERMADGFRRALEHVVSSHEPGTASSRSSIETVDHSAVLCPLCQSRATPRWRKVQFWQCNDCHLYFRHPVPSDVDRDELYRRSWLDPLDHCAETGGTHDRLAQTYARRLAKALGRRDFSGISVLDYGAGRGHLARALGELGADVVAIEQYGTEYLESLGISALRSVRHLSPGRRFQGIVCVDVIEHDPDPSGVIARLAGLLTKDGWLFVATPNPQGLSARLLRSRWREASKPGHLLFFSAETLARILTHAGFTSFRRLGWRIPYGRSVSSRMKDYALRLLRMDGELRYLAFRG